MLQYAVHGLLFRWQQYRRYCWRRLRGGCWGGLLELGLGLLRLCGGLHIHVCCQT
jgi:hypothetical protein